MCVGDRKQQNVSSNANGFVLFYNIFCQAINRQTSLREYISLYPAAKALILENTFCVEDTEKIAN
jgi:hypothetical protein